MARASNGDVELEYDTFGDRSSVPVLLVMGLGAQMIAWHDDFCRQLADLGHFVVRYDNRDVGLSTKTQGAPPDVVSMLGRLASGQRVDVSDVPYSLSEMAEDGLAVLDDLGIDAGHVVGASLGGMIVQQMAIDHPDRVSSLTSIMSTTGARDVGQGSPEAMAALVQPPADNRRDHIERAVPMWRMLTGPLFDEEEIRQQTGEAFDRSHHPVGQAFQLAASIASGDRTAGLRELSVPTLVVHGAVDPLIDVSGGRATAEAVDDADLLVIGDMGHYLARPLWPMVVGAIASRVERA